LAGSNFVCAGQLETINVHSFGPAKSMNKLYSPAGTVLVPKMSGTSVLRRVDAFAPARQTGGGGKPGAPTSFAALP
jgi:hypothetical protein